jgi:CRP/FNR family transcriptional regulator, cyclic AMP receptor protein
MILPEEMTPIEFLQNLGSAYANRVAMLAQLLDCAAGTVLFREGQESTCIYFVLSGTVALEIAASPAETIQICTVGPGELLGWSPLLGPNAMTATARTVDRCRLACLDVHQLDVLCEEDHSLGKAFMKQVALVLAKRLRATRLQLSRLLLHRPDV